MRPLLLGLALIGADVALLAERVVVVCVAASTPQPAAAAELAPMAIKAVDADFLALAWEDLTTLPTAVAPRELSAVGASHHRTPAVWKPP